MSAAVQSGSLTPAAPKLAGKETPSTGLPATGGSNLATEERPKATLFKGAQSPDVRARLQGSPVRNPFARSPFVDRDMSTPLRMPKTPIDYFPTPTPYDNDAAFNVYKTQQATAMGDIGALLNMSSSAMTVDSLASSTSEACAAPIPPPPMPGATDSFAESLSGLPPIMPPMPSLAASLAASSMGSSSLMGSSGPAGLTGLTASWGMEAPGLDPSALDAIAEERFRLFQQRMAHATQSAYLRARTQAMMPPMSLAPLSTVDMAMLSSFYDPLLDPMLNLHGLGLNPLAADPLSLDAFSLSDPMLSGQLGMGLGGRSPGGASQARRQTADRSAYERSRQMHQQVMAELPWEEYKGRVYEAAKDQSGCRALQQKLNDREQEVIDGVLEETKEHVVELMQDPFGNYLMQVVFEVVSTEQRSELLNICSTDLSCISLDMHGTRAVQRLIEAIAESHDDSQITQLCAALKPDILRLVRDVNGNHVIQKCLQKLPHSYKDFVFDAIRENCHEVATHRHGCCVMQRCLDNGSDAQRDGLVAEVAKHGATLTEDPYGNYVVQYSVNYAAGETLSKMLSAVEGRVPSLCRQKFASNVIEKFLQLDNAKVRNTIIGEIAAGGVAGELMLDQYANYVMQRVMQLVEGPHVDALLRSLRPALPQLRNTNSGRRICQKLTKRFPQLDDMEDVPMHHAPMRSGRRGDRRMGGR